MKLTLFLILTFSFVLGKDGNQARNKAVFIIGAPGSGKTITAKELQKQSLRAFIRVSTDLLGDQFPFSFNRAIGQKFVLEDFNKYPQYDRYCKLTVKEGKLRSIQGPDSAKLKQAIRVLFRNLLENRNNLVIDEVFAKPEHLNFYMQFVSPDKTDVYLIKLEIDPEIVRERQLNRDGLEFAYADLSKDIVFDLTLRTDELTPQQAAAAIIEHIEHNPPSAVFDAKNKIEFRY